MCVVCMSVHRSDHLQYTVLLRKGGVEHRRGGLDDHALGALDLGSEVRVWVSLKVNQCQRHTFPIEVVHCKQRLVPVGKT